MMAYPIKTYADIYDQTYGKTADGNRGHFGHLIIRDSNTAFRDFLLIGVNADETASLKFSIRLDAKQAKKIILAIQIWLARIGENEWERVKKTNGHNAAVKAKATSKAKKAESEVQ